MNEECRDLAPHGMCYLENKMIFRLAACIGVSAFVLPELAPWSLALTLIAAFLAVVSQPYGMIRLAVMIMSAALFVGVTQDLLSASLVTAILAALTVSKKDRLMAIGILTLQVSYVSSLESLIENYLHTFHYEFVAPALVGGLMVLLVGMHRTYWKWIAVLLPILIASFGLLLGLTPLALMIACGVPPLALSAVSLSLDRVPNTVHRLILLTLLVIGMIGWAITPPKFPNEGYVLLPDHVDSPEARLYRNYQDVLRFAGLPLSVVKDPNGIPNGSLVLLPWLTTSEHSSLSYQNNFRDLAIARGWIVVMIGEHTNIGGVADKIKNITERFVLRNDLTVPPKNSDESGHLRIADIRAWPPDAIFNRGASVEIRSPLDRILLAGDGWWAEPNIGEWLWVGDYLWQPSDRHGRLVLAASVDLGAARWVTVGDTGPFISQQLVSDPRPAMRILELATHLPLFLRDCVLVIISIAILGGFSVSILIVLVTLLLTGILTFFAPHDAPWRSLWRHESGFDERNFNNALTESPYLLNTRWKLVRPIADLDSIQALPIEPTVFFGLVDNYMTIGGVRLSACKRLGSLQTEEGPFLMDAQVCKIEGPAEILVGNKNEAAIIRLNIDKTDVLIVLDRNFLGQKAPSNNRRWLEQSLMHSRSVQAIHGPANKEH